MRIKMLSYARLKNIIIAKMTTHFPLLGKRFTDAFSPIETKGVPWAPLIKPLIDCKVAMVTTAGVHHKNQQPFDMNDPDGDPTYRILDVTRPITELMVTHDYYDHSGADKDINIVFPVQRLLEFESEGHIGKLAEIHFGVMGHIVGPHTKTFLKQIAPEVARKLNEDNVDVVLLTPG